MGPFVALWKTLIQNLDNFRKLRFYLVNTNEDVIDKGTLNKRPK